MSRPRLEVGNTWYDRASSLGLKGADCVPFAVRLILYLSPAAICYFKELQFIRFFTPWLDGSLIDQVEATGRLE